jgi:hypothetical protein
MEQKLMIGIVLVVVLIVAAALLMIPGDTAPVNDTTVPVDEGQTETPTETGAPEVTLMDQAKEYCDDENVAEVYICGDYIQVVSSLLGGGSTYYKDGEEIVCPMVGPDSMSEECRLLTMGSNCVQQSVCETPAEEPMPGSDRDEHGCIPSAGYQWCEALEKCVRDWEEPCGPNECLGMNYTEAMDIALASECGDNLSIDRWCNEGTGTYWIDLTTEKAGCNPACVIDVEAKTAEINWMCTGLVE